MIVSKDVMVVMLIDDDWSKTSCLFIVSLNIWLQLMVIDQPVVLIDYA